MTFGLRQRHYVEREHCGVTANLFTRRGVVDVVGPFNAALRSRGDVEWGKRVWAAGYPQAYCAAAVVRHPARRSLRELVHKARRVLGGRIDVGELATDAGSRARRWSRALLPPLDIKPMVDEVRRSHGRAAAARFYGAVYLARLAALVEDMRLALGGSSRR